MFGLSVLVLCQGVQLYVEIHQRSSSASLLLVDHQGSQCIPSHLRLSHHMDALQWVSRPLCGEAWGQCPVPILVAPCQQPIVRKPVISHEKNLAPTRAHPVRLMLAIQKKQLLIWVLLCLSTCDAPITESIVVVLPYSFRATLFLSGVAPLAHVTRSLSLPFSYYLSSFMWFYFFSTTSYVE